MSYDYIIVGAGSAGCVLANRLTEDAGNRVLLLEAGGRDTNPYIHIPAGFTKTLDDPGVNWCYQTEPEAELSGRRVFYPRGKVLGGSSSINGHIYIRGQPEDYDQWAQLGNRGWSFEDVLPYFKKSEDREGGGDAYHGVGGPLTISDPRERHEISEAIIRAAGECGVPRSDDINGAQHDGIGFYQTAMRNGRRCSAAVAFLKPARQRHNLDIETRALVERLMLDGKRAQGVAYRKNGKQVEARAAREVILAGGAVNSPQLLMVSGIGPSERLQALGIPVAHDLPGVGQNLQDHMMVRLVYRAKNAVTFNERTHGIRLLGEVVKYAFRRRGVLALAPGQVRASIKTRPELATADAQFTFVPASFADGVSGGLQKFPGMSCGTWLHRPASRGEIDITSADPTAAPTIQPNYLSDRSDGDAIVAALKIARQILQAPALERYRDGGTLPGDEVQTDAAWLDFARRTGTTVFHCVGTCKMGNDPMAVVDGALNVHGIEALRFVDASIMPTLVSANTNATVYMIAEKAADMIAGRPPLPPVELQVSRNKTSVR